MNNYLAYSLATDCINKEPALSEISVDTYTGKSVGSLRTEEYVNTEMSANTGIEELQNVNSMKEVLADSEKTADTTIHPEKIEGQEMKHTKQI